MKKKILAAAIALVALFTLSACAEARAFDGEITYIIGDGAGDQATIKKILLPGNTEGIDGDELKVVVPGNQRNYTVGVGGADRESPLVSYSKGVDGTVGPQIKVGLQLFWGLNQRDDALRAFYKFCSKYTCGSDANNEDRSSLANSSTVGWNNMLKENFSPALDRAANTVFIEFTPEELIGNAANQKKLADRLAQEFQIEVGKQYAGLTKLNLFCGNFAESSQAECTAPVFAVQSVSFAREADATAADNQRSKEREQAIKQQDAKNAASLKLQEFENQKAVVNAQIEKNKLLYGDEWQDRAFLLELARSCEGCTLVFGADGKISGVN